MNVAKSTEVKEQFNTVQVSINDINKSLNDVQYSTTVVRGYVRESLMKLENVEEKFVEHIDSTSGKINELVGKVDKMSLSKEDKPVPSSFL